MISRLARLLAVTLWLLALTGTSAPALATPSPTPEPDPDLTQSISGDQSVVDEPVELASGHVDIGPYLEDGRWRLLAHDDTDVAGSVWRELDGTVLRVDDAALQEVPDDPAYDFLGIPPGSQVHVVPQTQDPDVVWVGWNTQDPAVMDSVDRGVTLALVGTEGPGDLVVFLQDGGFGDPDVLWDSRSTRPDEVFVDVNTHTHANWVFTAPGVYLVTLEATAELIDGSTVQATGTLRFAVGGEASADEARTAVAALPASSAPDTAPDAGQPDPAAVRPERAGLPEGWLPIAAGVGGVLLALGVAAIALRGRSARRQAIREWP